MSRQIYRAPWHDYRSKCIYMVTLNKAPGVQDFGMLCGDPAIPRGQLGAPYVRATHVGVAIKDKIRTFYETDPAARIFQYALMPDHFHLLISIATPTQDTLSQIISRFKVAVNHQAGITPVFDKGFNDQILKPGRGLDTLFNYLRDNPRRLAVRRAHPEYFRRVNTLKIADKTYRAYGNFQLLVNPFKEQVVVHRADTPETREHNRRLWLHTAANGGVLVSPSTPTPGK